MFMYMSLYKWLCKIWEVFNKKELDILNIKKIIRYLKKNKPKFQKAIAVRTILKSKSELNISEERISLMMGKNCHLVIYPINKNLL